jgi:hypothetical protein
MAKASAMAGRNSGEGPGQIHKRLSALETKVAGLSSQNTVEPIWNLGFVRIKRTTDFIALVALVLSISTLGAQMLGYLKQAKLVSFPPYEIFIGTKKAMQRSRPDDSVLFIATTQYVNESLSGHNGIVQREYIRVRVNGSNRQYQYGPYQIVKPDISKRYTLDVPFVEEPSAFVVSAQSPISHQVLFQPFADSGCLSNDQGCNNFDTKTWYGWEDFKNDIKANTDGQNGTTIYITMVSTIYDTKWIFWRNRYPLSSQCKIQLNAADRAALISQQWLAPECRRMD